MTTTPKHTATVRRTGIIHAIAGAIVAVVLSVLGLGLVASAADRVTISITTTLSPKTTTIAVGTIVTWTNNDSQTHELRSTSGPVEFRSNPLNPGQSATFTFNTLGTYTYEDHQHSGAAAYQGTIIVSDAATPVTNPPAPGATNPPATTPPAPMTASVQLAGQQFSPSNVTVAVGATVTWLNNDGAKHTVTADNASFDSGTLNAGLSFVHTFTTAGTFAYGCDFHGNMRGTITVVAAGTTPPPATQPPATQPPATQPPATQPPATQPPATTPPAPGAPAITNASVTIANNTFSPASVTVNVGSTVSWANNDTVTHTITADDGSFASGLVKKATGWSKTFAAAGTFTYFCEIHPDMTGTVIVKAADGTAPAPATTVPSATTVPAAGSTGSTGSGAASAASAGAASGSITITDAGFTPASFHVALGGTVSFANNGKAMHTVTATDGSFDSDMVKAGGTWSHTFTTAGSFSYNCILHPNMKGTIVVGSGGSGGGSGSVGSANGASQASAASGQIESTSASGAAGAATSTESAIKDVNIDVSDNKFSPNPATVAQGATVTWKLVGAAAHTVTADDQSFNSGLLKPGETFQQTFNTLGSFTYACLVHPGMTATIDVVPPEQAAVAAPPAADGSGTTASQGGAATETATIAATDPAKSSGLMGSTLVGIAAVLVACCALLFALRAFLKVLGAPADDSTAVATSEVFTPNAI